MFKFRSKFELIKLKENNQNKNYIGINNTEDNDLKVLLNVIGIKNENRNNNFCEYLPTKTNIVNFSDSLKNPEDCKTNTTSKEIPLYYNEEENKILNYDKIILVIKEIKDDFFLVIFLLKFLVFKK